MFRGFSYAFLGHELNISCVSTRPTIEEQGKCMLWPSWYLGHQSRNESCCHTISITTLLLHMA